MAAGIDAIDGGVRMALDMFLDLEGVEGESLDKIYEGKIDVLGWSWGMSQSGTAHLGSGQGGGKVSVRDLSFTHYTDKASGTLMKFCCDGKHILKGKLIVRKAAGDKPLEYYIIELEDIIVSNISSGGTGSQDRLTENVTLNFRKFHMKYKMQEENGVGKDGPECKWDIAANTAA
jgi:type VI secretion system secreted protein Hcp